MKIRVMDIMAGLLIGVSLVYITCISYAFYSRYEIRKQLDETEFDLRKNDVDLSIVTRNEEKVADFDDLSLYEILEETGEIKYKLKVADKTYELQRITDRIVKHDIISLYELTDSRREELSGIIDKFNDRLINILIFVGLLGFITGTFISAKRLL